MSVSLASAKKKQVPKKRIPLPSKPPKVEPKPNAYKRKIKHPEKWLEPDDATKAAGDKT